MAAYKTRAFPYRFLNPAASLTRNNAFICFTTRRGSIRSFVLLTVYDGGVLNGKWRILRNEEFPIVKIRRVFEIQLCLCAVEEA